MGVRPKLSKAEIRKQFADKLRALRKAIVLNLSYVGELCVNQARSLETYKDQTGNLRSSVGYVIAYNASVQKSSFKGQTAQGKSEGRAYAESLLADYPSGYVLIVVAGMNYAIAVESRGLDVLTSAEQLAQRELPALLRSLKIDSVAA